MKNFSDRLRAVAALALTGAVLGAQAQTPLVPSDPYNYTRTTSYTYFDSTAGTKYGSLASETIEPDAPGACVTTAYDYDAQGNRTSATTANCAGASGRALFASRANTSSFAGTATQVISVGGANVAVGLPDGLLATSARNALNHAEARTYDPRFGEALTVKDANDLQTEWQLDDFGRKVVEKRPDGTRMVTWYCVVGAGLDTSSNSVVGGVPCPVPASGEAPGDAATFVHTEQRDAGAGLGAKMAPFARVYFDRLGREIRRVTESFDGAQQPAGRRGALVVTDVVYNAYGAKELETQPYFLASGSTTTAGSNDRGVTRTEYDVLGRVVRSYVVDARGSYTSVSFGAFGSQRASLQSVSYAGLTSTTTNDGGFTRKEEKNPWGEVVRVTDATGGQLVRQFDAFGNLAATKDPLQNVVALAYDLRGRKVQMNDPDAGLIDYCYDALGQLKAQQNALMRGTGPTGQCPTAGWAGTTATAVAGWATFAYDPLGRTTHRIDPEYQSNWYFDTYAGGVACNAGKGRLCESRTSHGVTRKIVYDSVGRLINQRTDITSGPSFASSVSYHATSGKLASKTYPTGVQVAYAYSALGFVEKLSLVPSITLTPLPTTAGGAAGSPVNLPAGKLLWQASASDAQGKIERQDFGNGLAGRVSHDPATGRIAGVTAGLGSGTAVLNHEYDWDSLGNLTARRDQNGDGSTGAVSETYAYTDGLNRLTNYSVAAANIPGALRTVTLDYNVLGMLLRKSDVGTYSYPAQGAGSVRPHAVRSIAGAANVSYDYDVNGNLKSATSGKYRSLTYNSFNLPDSNSGAQGPAGTPKYTWGYDEEHARFKEVHADAAGTRTTWYLHPDNAGGLAFESETAPEGKLSQRHYLSVGGDTVGVLVTTAALPTLAAGQTAPAVLGSTPAVKLEFWHEDHLGSLSATSDHLGIPTARYAYDPFGKRRQVDGNYDAAGNLVVDWSPAVNRGTDRGFTGHEHLDDIGLVHMNGRLYDAAIGRFMSADPHVTKPDVLQNYDRYSYVLNNPLNATDPTGFDSDPLLEDTQESVAWATKWHNGASNGGQIDQRAVTASTQFLSASVSVTEGQVQVQSGSAALYGGELDYGNGVVVAGGAFGKDLEGGIPISPRVDLPARFLRDATRRGVPEVPAEAIGSAAKPTVGALPKPATGRGTVPPSERDPKRVWTKEENAKQLKLQGGQCANCGKPTAMDNSAGHHKKRHADGGKTNPENHAVVCDPCHRDLHKRTPAKAGAPKPTPPPPPPDPGPQSERPL